MPAGCRPMPRLGGPWKKIVSWLASLSALALACASVSSRPEYRTSPAFSASVEAASETVALQKEGEYLLIPYNLRISNRGAAPLIVDSCNIIVERAEGLRWISVWSATCLGLSVVVLQPGDSVRREGRVAGPASKAHLIPGERPLTPGTYRFVVPLYVDVKHSCAQKPEMCRSGHVVVVAPR